MPPRAAYPVFMLLAMAVFLLARRLQPRTPGQQGLPWPIRLRLGLAAFIGGALGAKLPFALTDPSGFWTHTAWVSDGKTITTGLIGAYLTVEVTKAILGVRVKTGDSYALPLALAVAVGRWGCFFNGCCYGSATTLPWGVAFVLPDGSVGVRHPTQAYESLFHLTMAFVLAELLRRGLLVRQRLKLYLIAYGAYRFLSEFIRPEPAWLLGLTFYQWAALTLATGLAIQWVVDAGAVRGDGPPGPSVFRTDPEVHPHARRNTDATQPVGDVSPAGDGVCRPGR
jgi:phosphatidylglycerol:prolipoprotein diacylglycerol transferase